MFSKFIRKEIRNSITQKRSKTTKGLSSKFKKKSTIDSTDCINEAVLLANSLGIKVQFSNDKEDLNALLNQAYSSYPRN